MTWCRRRSYAGRLHDPGVAAHIVDEADKALVQAFNPLIQKLFGGFDNVVGHEIRMAYGIGKRESGVAEQSATPGSMPRAGRGSLPLA